MTVPGKDTLVLLTLLVTWLALLTSSNDAQPPLESVSRYGHKDFTTKERISNNSDTKIRVGDIPAVPGDMRMRRLGKAEAKAVPRNDSDYVYFNYSDYTGEHTNPNGSDYFIDSLFGYFIVPEFSPYDYGRAMRVGVGRVWALALSGLVVIAALLTP